MATKTYNIFISHSWAYGDAYEKLIPLCALRIDALFLNNIRTQPIF